MSAPLRVAVVGSGPAGFYAAGPLLAAGAEVDMIERLPTPWGLVRLGVAPDHPQLKTVSRAFEKIAAQPGFRFLGNVEVGRDLTHDDLARLYDAVIYSYGSAADRRLGIPGEDLRGSWAATELVAWYNGHPDYQQLDFDLCSAERVVVVGNGNVALDVARMLALTHDEIAPTDATDAGDRTPSPARAFERSWCSGRRGPVQASWTSTELHEMGELAGADIVVDPAELELDAASAAELAQASNIVQRNMDILREFAAREPAGKPRRVVLRFGVSPVAMLGEERVEGGGARPQRARRRTARQRARRGDRRARDDLVRARLSQRRLPRAAVSRACRSTRGAARCRTRAAVCSTRTGRRCPASTAPAGSSAGRPASSARTRRTRPRPSRRCWRTRRPALHRRHGRTAEAVDALLAERGVDVVDLRGLGGDRRGASAQPASRTGGRGSSSRAGTSCSTAGAQRARGLGTTWR